MAASTFADLVSEGALRAGMEGINTRIKFQVRKWLRSQAQLFLWPQCKYTKSGLALNVGEQALILGAGFGPNGGIVEEIHRINDPLHLYDSGFATRLDVRIRTDWTNAELQASGVLNNGATNRGAPSFAAVSVNQTSLTKHVFDVVFNVAADKDYLLELSYYAIPVDPEDAGVPWYPNDRTIEQAAYQMALVHNKDPEARNELTILAQMVAQDRMSEGMKPGINDSGIGLDSSIYR